MENFFGEVICSYTRADALADGELIDISKVGKEAGIKYPVVMTKAAYCDVVLSDNEVSLSTNSKDNTPETIDWRVWDVAYMFTVGARQQGNTDRILYPMIATNNGQQREVYLKAIIHGGDNGEPVITIMLPNED